MTSGPLSSLVDFLFCRTTVRRLGQSNQPRQLKSQPGVNSIKGGKVEGWGGGVGGEEGGGGGGGGRLLLADLEQRNVKGWFTHTEHNKHKA